MGFDPKAYLATKAPPQQQGGFDPQAYLAKKTAPVEPVEPEDDRGLLSKGFDLGMRGLDYGRGLVHTGVAQAIDVVHPRDVVTTEDWKNTLKGNAPTGAQYLEKMGVDEGPSVDLPLVGKTSLRDAEGFAFDMLGDPLGPVVRSVGLLAKGAKKAGTSIYKSGLKKIDERLSEKGADSLSGLLLKEGKTGTTAKLAKETEKIGKTALSKRNALYDEATKLGAKVDMSAATRAAEARVAKLRTDPKYRELADRLQDFIDNYKAEGFTDLHTASDWKSNLYDSLPETAYNGFGKLKGPAKEIERDLARGFKEAIEGAGDFVRPGLGKEIADVNKVMQTTITAKKPLAMQVRRAKTPMQPSIVDTMIGGYGLSDPGTAGLVLGAKKLGEISRTTWARTKAGKALHDLSKVPGLDQAVERGLINANKE